MQVVKDRLVPFLVELSAAPIDDLFPFRDTTDNSTDAPLTDRGSQA